MTYAPGLTVALTNDGGGSGTGSYSYTRVSGDCTVDGSTATIDGAASNCVVRVTREADDDYAATTDDATITVNKGTQASLQALTDGTNGTIAAYLELVALTTSGGSGDGIVTWAKISGDCTVDGSTATIGALSSPTVNCVVEATKAFDDDYQVATDQVTITVTKAAQDALMARTDGTDGTTATTSETVELSTSGGSGTGSVTYQRVSGSCAMLDADTVQITGLSANCIIEATQAADNNYFVTTDRVTITVGPAVTLPTTSVSPTVRKSGRNATVRNPGTWAANGGTLSDYSYQWYQCTTAKSAVGAASSISAPGDCVAISGATTSTWRISGVNRRHLRVLVTRSNEAGSAYAWSATFRR